MIPYLRLSQERYYTYFKSPIASVEYSWPGSLKTLCLKDLSQDNDVDDHDLLLMSELRF